MQIHDNISVRIAGDTFLGVVTQVHPNGCLDARVFLDDGDPLKSFDIPHASAVPADYDGHIWHKR